MSYDQLITQIYELGQGNKDLGCIRFFNNTINNNNVFDCLLNVIVAFMPPKNMCFLNKWVGAL